MRPRKTLAIAALTSAIALPVSLFTAAAAQADQDGAVIPGAVCHTIDVDNGIITAVNRCTTGPLTVAEPTTKATPPKGYRS